MHPRLVRFEGFEGIHLVADVWGDDDAWPVLLLHGGGQTRHAWGSAASVQSPDVLVAGHPYIDIWTAVKPAALGIGAWPAIPPGTPWKEGVCTALGVDDPRRFWRHLLAAVHDWKDLEQPFVAAVEQLIDFVT